MTFTVLFVCTGNVARSPVAEQLYRAWLAPRTWQVHVTSAGTRALVGEPATDAATALVQRHGGDLRGHRARALTPALIDAADVVLTMTREHRAAVVRMKPAAVRRTHTVREAARAAASASLPPGRLEQRWRALVPALAAGRGRSRAATASDDDVVDPFGRNEAFYQETADQLLPALRVLVEAVATDDPPQ